MSFLSFLRVTEPHCSARPSMILVDASSASPPTSNRSEWRSSYDHAGNAS